MPPILFAIYIDGLLVKLKDSGEGCHIGNHYTGALGFADDLSLLCPTRKAMRISVNTCSKYAEEYGIKFNGKKSQYMFFRGTNCAQETKEPFIVEGDEIKVSESAVHLGHRISSSDKHVGIKGASSNFWKGFNMFMCNFGHVYSFVKCKLFKQYCCSFYGAPLWILDSNSIRELHVAYRKALRQTWSVPYNTHTRTVLSLSEVNPLETQLYKRVCKYMRTNLNHANPVVKAVSNICLDNPWSVVGNNYKNAMAHVSQCTLSTRHCTLVCTVHKTLYPSVHCPQDTVP